MYKILTMICLVFLSGISYGAGPTGENCADRAGRIMVGNNGQRYCLSYRDMNWWTVLSWCQSGNMRPFEYPKDCYCQGTDCPNNTPCPSTFALASTQYWWTGTPHPTNSTYATRMSTGGRVDSFERNQKLPAICVIGN